MKIIPITKGQSAIVDDIDFPRLSQHKWYARAGGRSNYYAYRYAGFRKISRGRYSALKVDMHKDVLQTDGEIDHINGDSLDNTRSNLRVADRSQNVANSDKRRIPRATSIYKGVSRSGGQWRARVRQHYTSFEIGRFTTEIEAARAYDVAAVKLFGEFARLNFPMKGVEQSAL